MSEVRLRPVTSDDAELLARWRSSTFYRGDFNDFGVTKPSPVNELIKENRLENRLVDEFGGTLIVELAEIPIGTVSWRQVGYGPNPESLAWNIGIALIPEARGQGFGTQAQRMLADYLFATTSANRVEASTDVDNVAEGRALEKAGFSRDGVLKGAQYRAGAWHDLAVYSVVRGDRAR
ncbi:MAG: GNAT family protein [Candidatus Dormibacteraceae bacterium]